VTRPQASADTPASSTAARPPVDASAVVLAATAGGLFLAPFAYAAVGGPHIGGGVACLARQAVGLPCPFCGLTTSFTFAARGRVGDAFAAAPVGPLLWVLCGVVAVWLLTVIVRRRPLALPRVVPGAVLRTWWVWLPTLVVAMWVWQYFRVVVWRWYV
jgi:cellobiose-specific phosphotransferase system component IIC